MEGLDQSRIEDDGRTPQSALVALKRREQELLATNEMQIKLASMIFSEEATLENMLLKWITSEEHYSERFRNILEDNHDIKERVLKGDESVVNDILKLLVN